MDISATQITVKENADFSEQFYPTSYPVQAWNIKNNG